MTAELEKTPTSSEKTTTAAAKSALVSRKSTNALVDPEGEGVIATSVLVDLGGRVGLTSGVCIERVSKLCQPRLSGSARLRGSSKPGLHRWTRAPRVKNGGRPDIGRP